MHPASAAAAAAPPAPPPSPPLLETLDLINHLLSLLLVASLSVKSFVGRWQVLRSRFSDLRSSVAELSAFPHWSENPLLHTLLPSLAANLRRLKTLADHCSAASFDGGKLLMQSDLDMASAALSNHLQDLDLLLRSGVLLHSNAIVLSQPRPGSSKEDLGFFIRDVFTRLQIGGTEFKKKALEALLRLLDEDEKAVGLVAKEGRVSYLIRLLDVNGDRHLLEQAALAVSILATASDSSQKSIFEEGGLGPLLRILESGSSCLREKAAAAVEAITSYPDHAWAISAYGGVAVLLDACRSGSLATQAHAAGAIRNSAAAEDVRMALAEEGAVPVLLHLLASGTSAAQEKAAAAISILAATGDRFRSLLLQEQGLQKLFQAFQELSNADTIEHVLRAIASLSAASDSINRTLSYSTAFAMQLAEAIRHGNIILQQTSASLVAALSMSDGNKRAIAGCMPALVKQMELAKPAGMQEAAAAALVSLLTVRSNRKELVRDEKSLMRLVHMLDPKNDAVSKNFPVTVVSAILSGGSAGCRKRLLGAGAQPHLQRLAEAEVAGARRALQRLAGNRLKTMLSRAWRE